MVIDRQFRKARLWSNKVLRKYAGDFTGEIANVSGWKDSDKSGGRYKDYFVNAKKYFVTNYGGHKSGIENEIELDLEEPLSQELKERFDVVFNHTTLEHIFLIETAFGNLCSMAKDAVILVVPFAQVQHAGAFYKDYWRFSPWAIMKLFEKNNFTLVVCEHNNHTNSAIYLFCIGIRNEKLNNYSDYEKCNIDNLPEPGQRIGRSYIYDVIVFLKRFRSEVLYQKLRKIRKRILRWCYRCKNCLPIAILIRITKFRPLKKKIISKRQVEAHTVYSIKDKHVFFGYYDVAQINKDGTKLLVHVVDKDADSKHDEAEIGCFDIETKEYAKIATTKAWCWQMGARLRWHPLHADKILYNDKDGDGYVTKIADTGSGISSNAATCALYDNSYDFKYGVSVNFSRLQRLRPGYGYPALPDMSKNDFAPEDDGVFLVDLESGTTKLVASLRELSKSNDMDLQREHYINHVSFSPDGRKFTFFHLSWSASGISRVNTLYMYDINTGSLGLLEDKWTSSHYSWRSDDELLVIVNTENGLRYVVFNVERKAKEVMENISLKMDVHPSFLSDSSGFIFDTYPDAANYQKLCEYDLNSEAITLFGEFYHYPVKMRDERCDLHPRIWENGSRKMITIDTTYDKGLRQVVLLRPK